MMSKPLAVKRSLFCEINDDTYTATAPAESNRSIADLLMIVEIDVVTLYKRHGCFSLDNYSMFSCIYMHMSYA